MVLWQLPRNFHRNVERLEGFARALRAWARKTRRWTREGHDVHVYFDNDAYGYAPRNALRLIRLTET